MRAVSSVVGGLFLVLLVTLTLTYYERVYSAGMRSLEGQEEAMQRVYQAETGELALSYAGPGEVYAFNPGPRAVTVTYSISYDPFRYSELDPPVIIGPGEGVTFRGDALLTSAGALCSPEAAPPWVFVAYSGSGTPTASGYFEVAPINLSLSWVPIPGEYFPFPSGENGSSVMGYRLVRCSGGPVKLSVSGGYHVLGLDGVILESGVGAYTWAGNLTPGEYELSIRWTPLFPADHLSFNATGVYPRWCPSSFSPFGDTGSLAVVRPFFRRNPLTRARGGRASRKGVMKVPPARRTADWS